MPNRLAAEQSPYLLQHAGNPVDWYPWGEEAFGRARAEQRPIFLSIGYSTCHWCHVMEHESFEDAATADLLNAHFVPVKVDREERPDVDRVYMTFVQATTGSGGWPLSVWLTPDLKPFYGGTYFPPVAAMGRPSFGDVLTEIARAWREERETVTGSAAHIVSRLETLTSEAGAPAEAGEAGVRNTLHAFQQAFDARHGGFGDQPKFPRPSELLFLLREHVRGGDDMAREMVLATLRAMALGGLRDHIGGGFHRYSVDRAWRVPHFEKMLYDQAQLALAYLEAAQLTRDPFHAQIAEDTLQYVARELTDEAGGFQSAEDADSVPPAEADNPAARKTEGAFYLWTTEELREALGEDSQIFELRFGCLPDGNAPFDPQQEFGRGNLLHTARSVSQIAEETGRPPEMVAQALVDARTRLFTRREGRPHPHRDDKVLTAWNGLMIAAFARGARVLAGGEALGQQVGGADPGERHLASAQRAAAFMRERMWDAHRGLLRRRYRQGDAAIDGYAEDYACLVFGLLELVQADGDPAWLDWAIALQQRMDALFGDEGSGAYFSTTGDDPSVLLRLREDYDGAEPAPTSMAALNLLALGHLTGERAFLDRAARARASFAGRLDAHGRTIPMMAAAVSAALAPAGQIVIVGPPGRADTAAMTRAAVRAYRPFTLVLPIDPARASEWGTRLPWTAAMAMVDGKATAYVCRDFACDAPTTRPEDL
ncbi:MAG: thioredoxin domain-containing protein [Vicinamibacterales bacterium]